MPGNTWNSAEVCDRAESAWSRPTFIGTFIGLPDCALLALLVLRGARETPLKQGCIFP